MIKITVTGDTYSIRRVLKANQFIWDATPKRWHKTVTEASLNRTLEAIRPLVSWSDEPSPKITVTLHSVDAYGNEMHDGRFLRFKLKSAGDREGTNFFKKFLEEVSGFQVVTTTETTLPANAGMKEKGNVDEAFF